LGTEHSWSDGYGARVTAWLELRRIADGGRAHDRTRPRQNCTVPAKLRSPWSALVPVVCVLAGFGFATSAHIAHGTDLRSSNTGNLAGLVSAAEQQVRDADQTLAALQAQVTSAEAAAGAGNTAVRRAEIAVRPLQEPAGLTSVSGPGLTVVLDDAHSDIVGVDPNQLVVHQSDLQSVVNALWAGGAEAMSIAGQRVIATSAVRCVGNTLLLNGNVYSPPFRVVAIGPSTQMQERLDASPGVKLFKQAAEFYGLGYTVESEAEVTVPAYTGSVGLVYARGAAR
jgi:uncharacterized protein YlxW (UPF0749 family)